MSWLACGLSLSAAGTLTCDQTSKDIQAGPDAKTVTADFNFKNESSEDVIVERYNPDCPCLKAQILDGKLGYKPGESGVIRVDFDVSLFSGIVSKSVAVWLKGDPTQEPSMMLTTRVTIPVLVEMEPKTLIWEVGEKPEPKTITLTMKHSEPIKVNAVTGADARFQQELTTIEEGKKYEVVVTPASTGEVGMGVIHIETDCTIERHRSQRVFTVIRQAMPKPEQTAATP